MGQSAHGRMHAFAVACTAAGSASAARHAPAYRPVAAAAALPLLLLLLLSVVKVVKVVKVVAMDVLEKGKL